MVGTGACAAAPDANDSDSTNPAVRWRSDDARMVSSVFLFHPASSRQSAGAKLMSTSWLS